MRIYNCLSGEKYSKKMHEINRTILRLQNRTYTGHNFSSKVFRGMEVCKWIDKFFKNAELIEYLTAFLVGSGKQG